MSPMQGMNICYRCERPRTSREHVPPQSFFPVGRRDNLWTVPSCDDHNSANSKDVEYVRNLVSTQRGTNAAAEAALDVAKRSWDRRPALFHRTFNDIQGLVMDGEEVIVFPFDLVRVRTVMSAVGHALAFRDFGRNYMGEWRVFCATLHSETPEPKWDGRRAMLVAAPFEPIGTPQPEVFAYGIHRMQPAGFVYRMVFYEGFVVFTWPVLKNAG